MGNVCHVSYFVHSLTILLISRGGIRGVVELEALRHLEKYLGGNIPIQAFFDLIVGTRFVNLIFTHSAATDGFLQHWRDNRGWLRDRGLACGPLYGAIHDNG